MPLRFFARLPNITDFVSGNELCCLHRNPINILIPKFRDNILDPHVSRNIGSLRGSPCRLITGGAAYSIASSFIPLNLFFYIQNRVLFLYQKMELLRTQFPKRFDYSQLSNCHFLKSLF